MGPTLLRVGEPAPCFFTPLVAVFRPNSHPGEGRAVAALAAKLERQLKQILRIVSGLQP